MSAPSLPPLIIEAAINGATSKAMNPHVPRSVPEIVESACACIAAGAAIVHHHNNDGLLDGRHASDPYRQAWTAIYERHPDTLLYPTMGGGGPHTNIAERYAHVEELADAGVLRLALIDPGSVSLGPLDGEGLPAAIDLVYQNTFADVRYMVDCCNARRLGTHISIFEPGFLRVALAYHAAGRLPPSKIQLYFGGPTLPFGLPPTAASLDAYQAMLGAHDLPWMVGILAGDVSETLAELAIARGGHVRVGLEDYAGPHQPTNEELVSEIVQMAHRANRAVATPTQAADILRVPGRVE
ncbi:MAG: 3-keto-5-aminohexanoate cleavage protein [Deltaproteobacteria bacterium]|nr:3-keto-5-aminohexanoate cleavage protein [Deltaproteobacteria bacterium]MBI3386415.1 3-keto-5-aminohexanoate cleavage protein [Deltaproteobacteria bacterium]